MIQEGRPQYVIAVRLQHRDEVLTFFPDWKQTVTHMHGINLIRERENSITISAAGDSDIADVKNYLGRMFIVEPVIEHHKCNGKNN